MMPIAPALETADASCARAIQPIGAWTMGYWTPSSSVMRFRIMTSPLVVLFLLQLSSRAG